MRRFVRYLSQAITCKSGFPFISTVVSLVEFYTSVYVISLFHYFYFTVVTIVIVKLISYPRYLILSHIHV